MVNRKEIIEAYLFLRENNQSIPDATLDFILNSSLDKLEELEKDQNQSN